jgi:dTDP-4-dehydrorhamnose reductase
MSVLVLGRHGQLAQCLRQRLTNARFLGREDLDLEMLAGIGPAIRDAQPAFIVIAAAYTAVDAAEDDRDTAWRVNADAVEEIGRAAAALDVPVLHVSSDYVFAGDADRPYREGDPTSPVNAYGASKLDGERALAASGARHWWVFRTSSVFSEFGANFVKTMLRLAGEGRALRVVSDQVSRPTYAGHVADAIVRTITRFDRGEPLPAGIYHCASAGASSWFELARTTFERAVERGLLDAMPSLDPIGTADYPTRAKRPRYSVLDTGRLEEALGWSLPPWRDGLDDVLGVLQGNGAGGRT